MTLWGQYMVVLSFLTASVWAYVLIRVALGHHRPRPPIEPPPCRCTDWRILTHYETGHQKRQCLRCGRVSLFVPPFKRHP
jgi:hypothetical protein